MCMCEHIYVCVYLPILSAAAAASAKSLQSCPTLCDPIDGSPSGSTIPGILQARTLECVAISFSNAWKWKVKVKLLSHVRLFSNPMDCSLPGSPSMGFSRQEYWSGVPSLPLIQLCFWQSSFTEKIILYIRCFLWPVPRNHYLIYIYIYLQG